MLCFHILSTLTSVPLALLPASPASFAPRGEAAPHYAARLRHRLSWLRFPLRVAFPRDASYTPGREAQALRGFNLWGERTGGFVGYTVVGEAAQADIVVRFDLSTDDGWTTTRFRNDRIFTAAVCLGVRRGSDNDLAAIAAHEFGHALGIDGHSDDDHDLMYPIHRAGTPGRISDRDLETFCDLYPAWQRPVPPG